ncbi:MAG: hypothetical protein HZA07_02145 [Nitrospirae bacterium]|nr:hypothetical protein [Nitrospirota bacterium]
MKKIAVLVRDRQSEALRMSIGLTLMDDKVDIFVLDRRLGDTNDIKFNLEMINEMGLKMYTNIIENEGIDCISTKQLANKLLEYDIVLPY